MMEIIDGDGDILDVTSDALWWFNISSGGADCTRRLQIGVGMEIRIFDDPAEVIRLRDALTRWLAVGNVEVTE